MATTKTFDTSRVGGGTYELHRDATTGSYSLKSVGFDQVNKLTLPELASQDAATTTTTAKTDTTKTDTTTTTADPYKQLSKANLGGDTQQDYGSMLKTPKVKEATVRDPGEMVNTTYNQMTDTEKEAVAAGTSGMTFRGAGDATKQYVSAKDYPGTIGQIGGDDMREQYRIGNIAQSDPAYTDKIVRMEGPYSMSTAKTYRTPRTIADQNKYLGRTFPQKTTGLQKVTSKAKALGTDAISKAKKAIGIVTKMLIPGANLISAMTPERTATQQVNIDHFNVRGGSVDGQRIAGNPATDLYAGMNRNSAFGNLERAGNKRIATREKTIAKRGIKSASNPNGVSQDFVNNTNKMKGQSTQYKAKKKGLDTKNPNEMRNVDKGGGDKGSDSGRVICTELHRTGEMSTVDWVRDIKFTYKNLSKDHIKGYLFWAVPTVKHIQKYPRYRKIWKHIAQHRANDIAWRLSQGRFDLLGRIYAGIGEPLCWLIGKCVSDKQLKELKLNSWRRA